MKKALCYGIACCDIMVPGIEPDDFKRENVCVEKFTYSTGGDAMNQAVTLSKLGHDAVLLTMLGNDIMGDFLVGSAKKAGLNTDYIRFHESLPTSLTLVCVHRDGNRNFIFNKGADIEISGECVPAQLMDMAGVIGIGSAFGDIKLTESLQDVLRSAKEKGLYTCVDIMHGSCYDDARGLENFLPYTDYIFPNEDEGFFLTGEKERDKIAEKLLSLGCGCVVLKTGKEGCILYKKNGEILSVPGYIVDMIDTTGAGDNFMAGFMAGLLEGLSDRDCARLANATGAASVRYIGAAGISSRAEVEDLMTGSAI